MIPLSRSITGVGVMPISGLRSEEHTSELQSHVNLVCRPPSYTLFPYTTLFRSARTTHRSADLDRRQTIGAGVDVDRVQALHVAVIAASGGLFGSHQHVHDSALEIDHRRRRDADLGPEIGRAHV